MSRTLATLLTLLASFCLSLSINANEDVYQTTMKSTALITTGTSVGTGVLVDRDEKLVVTNFHVIDGFDQAVVFFPVVRGERVVSEMSYYMGRVEKLGIRATVVAQNQSRDIAILKLERLPSDVQEIEFGTPSRPGQTIHSVGNPGASNALWNYTFGKVRQNYYVTKSFKFGMAQMQMMETTSPVNQGDSGGPIVNDAGQLVGITQGYNPEYRNYSYGVDISEITWFLKKYRSGTVSPEMNSTVNRTNKGASLKIVAGNFNDSAVFRLAKQGK